MLPRRKKARLCSACLLGVGCRFDGASHGDQRVLSLLKNEILIPVCPESLGGLGFPRPPSEQRGDKVFNAQGLDVTEPFLKGAREVLKIARLFNVQEAVFKQRSPSCGCGQVYDGSFSGKVVAGDGVTSALLKSAGLSIITEEDL